MSDGVIDIGNLAVNVGGLGRNAGYVLITVVLAIVFYWVGSRAIRRVARTRIGRLSSPAAQRRMQTAATLLQHTLRYVILFGAALAVASFFRGEAIAIVLTSIAGVALGFGAQSLLKDLIAGIFMIFEGQFAVGDRVRLHGVDVEGEIVEAGIRVTILKDDEGHAYYVPNGAITAVKNFTSQPARVEQGEQT